jgi:A/G-specific adenine glycosylase
MDYGTYLKQTVDNPNRRSKHHSVQSKFEGSQRQLRGQVIRLLGAGSKTQQQLATEIRDDRLNNVIKGLLQENLIHQRGGRLSL